MANYNREILVPYLRDVCSVELLCRRLEKDRDFCQEKIDECSHKINRMREDTHDRIEFWKIKKEVCYLALCLVALPGVWWLITDELGFLTIFYIIGFGIIVCGSIGLLLSIIGTCIEDRNENKENAKYNARLDKENPQYEEQMKKYQRTLSFIQSQLKKAQVVRQQAYSVNIIPARYRNVYVAYYLYDYFSTSRETDLDKVIQTLLLDEIKQRLDKIIVQNESILMNQRYQTALQERQNEMLASNHREQMRRMARMEQNQELQADYLNMIEQNQKVTNFILAMDFLYK